ncbi:MAG: Xaa-Pro peptidase family protein [Thermodesulfobacteriota bacterium]|nr:Xaa-Pro peptidase family protein [Thermodesulfobacteriota bacterium]
MAFTKEERGRRHKAIEETIRADGLRALLLTGDTGVGIGSYGDLRYYTDMFIIFYRQVVVVFPDSEPVLFAYSEISRQAAVRRSAVKDCRFTENLIADAIKLLKERGISTGRVGINFEVLPVAWHSFLKQELPQVDWVETHDRIMQIRSQRSQEEEELFRKGSQLGDGGFEAAVKMIRPGASEYEIVSEIERYARAGGAEAHFTLIGSGKFALGDCNALPLPYSPSPRRVEDSDSIVMEITPRYEGYWTQLVRTVNVGKPNRDLEKMHRVCCDAIKKGLKWFKPGKTMKEVVLAMESYVTDSGYILKPPLGHICGIDLLEARVSRQNENVLEPGMAVIIHPTVFTPDGKNSFFWGETYLVNHDGYERLHRSTDELLTV